MTRPGHLEAQRELYRAREHQHLRPREGDRYAEKLVDTLARRSGIGGTHRLLEVGAGFGRFSFRLLERCHSLVALDLSSRVLAELEDERNQRKIPAERCRTVCGDATSVEGGDLGLFDFVVGLFILHHLPDVPAAIRNLARLLRPGGSMVFLEPNRRNPLYPAQLACCRDMTWREEKGLFRLSVRSVESACRGAGLEPIPVFRFGFFPPQIFNRARVARQLEARLERLSLLEPLLPFLLLQARLAAEAAG